MGTQYLLDTSAISKYLKEVFSENGLIFMDSVIENNLPKISVITQIELLSWKIDDFDDNIIVENFIKGSKIFSLSDEVITQTISLRRKYKIKTPDAIIAATALVNNLTLITDNDRDFLNIKDLQVINPNTVH
ncbi:MAG: type II toxin-antitoxin system VapC family toxin [Arcicella sp.]|jgi:hypothetical protein|nr:type II toxin-antitoxin system VapC family toxin [Arcicella sp.]